MILDLLLMISAIYVVHKLYSSFGATGELEDHITTEYEIVTENKSKLVYIGENSYDFRELDKLLQTDPGFSLENFLDGARKAYIMIQIAAQKNKLSDIRPLVSDELLQKISYEINVTTQGGSKFLDVVQQAISSIAINEFERYVDITLRIEALYSVVSSEYGNGLINFYTITFRKKLGLENKIWQLVEQERIVQ